MLATLLNPSLYAGVGHGQQNDHGTIRKSKTTYNLHKRQTLVLNKLSRVLILNFQAVHQLMEIQIVSRSKPQQLFVVFLTLLIYFYLFYSPFPDLDHFIDISGRPNDF